MTAWISVGYDAGRLGGLTGTLTETGGGGATGAISMTGQYAHWIYSEDETTGSVAYWHDPVTGLTTALDTGYVNFALALQAALNAIGDATYSVTFDPDAQRYTISASGGGVTSFTISSMAEPMYGMIGALGTASISSAGLSWTTPTTAPVGRRIAHFMSADNGGWSEWAMSSGDIGGEDLVGSDGSARGLTALSSTTSLDFVVPLEPIGKVWIHEAAVTRLTTWDAVFRRARASEPLWISDPRGLNPYADAYAPIVAYMRADSCVLRPRLMAADYLAYQSIPIGAYVIGTGTWFNQV